PMAASSSSGPGIVRRYVPAGTMIVSAPAWAFASWIAARRVQVLAAVTHLPSPGAASTASVVSLTVNVAAAAGAAASNSAATPRRKRLTGAMEGEAKTNARYAGGCQDCPRGGGCLQLRRRFRRR